MIVYDRTRDDLPPALAQAIAAFTWFKARINGIVGHRIRCACGAYVDALIGQWTTCAVCNCSHWVD